MLYTSANRHASDQLAHPHKELYDILEERRHIQEPKRETTTAQMCLNIGTPKTIIIPFVPNGKLMVLAVPIFKHFRVLIFVKIHILII